MRKPGIVYKVGNLYDKKCGHCEKVYKVEVLQNLRGNGKFENRLRVIGDGRLFHGVYCPSCFSPQKRGEVPYKPRPPKTPSSRARTPAQWCSRGQTRRITKYLRRHHPNTNLTPSAFLGASGLEVAKWIESQFFDHPQTGQKMRWEDAGVTWEIDHKIEVGRFDKSDIEALKKALHYTNLQPMWKDLHKVKTQSYHEEITG